MAILLTVAPSCSKDTAQTKTITCLEDLNGETVAVIGGSVQDLLISKVCPEATLLRTETDTDLYTMVAKGKASITLESSISWMMAKSEYPEIMETGVEVQPLPLGIAFNKDKKELLAQFNEFLADYLAQGNLEKAIEEWSDPDSPRKMPDPADYDGSNGTLKFATSTIVPPFNFIKNGVVSGVESEILALFAISKNMKWEFVDLSFSGLITYISSGKADAGCCIMCITPERAESVDFSIPWTEESSIILVNKNAFSGASADADGEGQDFFKSVKESFHKSLIKEDRYLMLLKGLWATVVISLLAALFGTLLGMVLCYTSLRKNRFVSGLTNLYIEFMRCMPQVVLLMIMFYVVFGKSSISGLWVAIISFALCFGAYTSVIFRTALKSIDKGQTEAALSMGFSRIKAFWHVIMPQTVQRALPVYKGEFIGLVKATSIVGYIAVFDLTKAGDIIRSRTYEAFFPLILVTVIYFLVIWVLTILLKYAEVKTQPKRKKFYR